MKRHNRVVDILDEALSRRGYTVTKEHRLISNTTATNRRRQPDIIAVKDDTAVVVYGYNVNAFHTEKEWRYRAIQRRRKGGTCREHPLLPCHLSYADQYEKIIFFKLLDFWRRRKPNTKRRCIHGDVGISFSTCQRSIKREYARL